MKILFLTLLFLHPVGDAVGDPNQLAKIAEGFSDRAWIAYEQAIQLDLQQTFINTFWEMSIIADDLEFIAEILSTPQSKSNDLKLRLFARLKISGLKIKVKLIRKLQFDKTGWVLGAPIADDAEKLIKEFEEYLAR